MIDGSGLEEVSWRKAEHLRTQNRSPESVGERDSKRERERDRGREKREKRNKEKNAMEVKGE